MVKCARVPVVEKNEHAVKVASRYSSLAMAARMPPSHVYREHDFESRVCDRVVQWTQASHEWPCPSARRAMRNILSALGMCTNDNWRRQIWAATDDIADWRPVGAASWIHLRSQDTDFARFPVHVAAVMNDMAWLESNIDTMDPNARDKDGLAPIHYAAAFGSSAAARVLLDAGARLDICSDRSGVSIFPVVVARVVGATIHDECSMLMHAVFHAAVLRAEQENRDRVFLCLSDGASPFRVLPTDVRRHVAAFAPLPNDAPVTRAMLSVCLDAQPNR